MYIYIYTCVCVCAIWYLHTCTSMIELPPLGWDNDYEPLWRTWPPQKCGVKARETAEEMNEEGFMVMLKPSLVGGLDYW